MYEASGPRFVSVLCRVPGRAAPARVRLFQPCRGHIHVHRDYTRHQAVTPMTLVLFAIALIVVAAILVYNNLAGLRQMAANAWADIDVQLKRRHDLVPNLVAVVKGHAGYERGTLEAVVDARNRAVAAGGPAQAGVAERELAGSVRQLVALAEAYPDLKTGQSFLELQRNLTEIEDHVQDARRYYNAVVRDYNTRVAQFPINLLAGAMGFRPREFFGLTDEREQASPSVDFGGQA